MKQMSKKWENLGTIFLEHNNLIFTEVNLKRIINIWIKNRGQRTFVE